MKLSLSWLREWVSWPESWDANELARRLTLSGFEVESISPAAPPFQDVVVGEIISAERHPQADKLQLCRVQIDPTGARAPLQIVCGATNARAGLKSALAKLGARLPRDRTIKAERLRGAESAGMLCSALELGLAEKSEGIIELPDGAPIGADVRALLDLDDSVLEVNVTPNRGDAMSVLGLARELAALTGEALRSPPLPQGLGTTSGAVAGVARIDVRLEPGSGAARLLACVVDGLDNTSASPLWLSEPLRRMGVRSISPVVDATNYVMLELGQPLHAYDLARLHGGLGARRARAGERLRTLDGRELALDPGVLVIGDEHAPVGLAGVMGGELTAVQPGTRAVALEAAWFDPAAVAGRARRFGLQTDASQRFERGVDFRVQERALARCRDLVLALAGGRAGTVSSAELSSELPVRPVVPLRARQLTRLIGQAVAAPMIEQRLRGLGIAVTRDAAGQSEPSAWRAQPPSWRFDLTIEADLIEEVVRLGGLELIEERDALMPVRPRMDRASRVEQSAVLHLLAARGYQESISFAFVDPPMQRWLFGEREEIELENPIAADLAVMRGSLWPGLIAVARDNTRRQQSRVRLFEIGDRFVRGHDEIAGGGVVGVSGNYREQKMIAGLALGSRLPEQWGSAPAAVDFHDVKADVEALLGLGGRAAEFSFEPGARPCLHPHSSARIMRDRRIVGYIGPLHPRLVRELDLPAAPVLFELDYDGAFDARLARFQAISRFPQIRRDLSITVPEGLAFAAIRERVSVVAAGTLQELRLFDVYQGDGIEKGRKSIALGLILQDLNRTLTDEDADRAVRAVLQDLQTTVDARLRE
jgi:phenylalanyl-tRNA synthetase beta chain